MSDANIVGHDLTVETADGPMRLYEAKPLGELAESARAAVTREFKQTPENIVLAFTLSAAPGKTAQAGQAPVHAME